ncbi:3'5'-cyclic nucleotide phosphodiesterase, partial [Helicosporidium sp. ATCC 50920]
AAVWTLARAWARWREELAERKKKKTGAGERSLRLLSDGGAQRDGQERNGHSVPVFVGKETSQASGLSPTVPSDSLVEASGRSPLVSKPEPKPAEPGWSGPSADIGMELIDTTTLQVATLLVLAMVGTALLTPAARLASLPDPFRAVLAALDHRARELPSGDCAGLQGLVDVLLRVGASSSVLGDQLPVALLVGPTCEWTWTGDERAESRRSSDRLVLEWGEAWLELNIARQHRAAALRDLGLMAAMLGALLCFSTLINLTVYRVLLAPLERIFSTLRSQAAQILSALPAQEGGDGQPGADRDRGVATIEAAVEKMARLVAHVNAGGGGQGAHIASGLMLSADAAARDWLAAATGIKGKGGGRIEEDEDDEFGAEGGRDLYDGLAEPQATSASAQSLSPVQGRNVSSAQEEGWAPAQPSTPPQAPSPTASAASGEAAAPGPWPEQTPLQDWQVDALAAALQLLHASPLHSGADVCAFDVLTLPAEMLVPFGCALFLWRGLVRDAEVEDKVPALRDAASWQHRGALLNPTSPSSHLSISPSLAPSSNPPASKPSRLTSWVPTSQLWRFVEALEARYRANPYHNFRHALDVAATCAGLCLRVAAFAGLAPADERALLLAALAHDLEHPGVNNAFLVQAREALARTYNDASVLENRHAAALFDLLAQRPDADVLGRLPPKSWRATRAAVIAAILHTDMIHHFPMVSQLEVFCELHGAQLTSVYQQAAADAGSLRRSSEAGAAMFSSAENRQFLLNVLLHAADISNAAKPISLGVPWSDRVLAESFAQGEQERARGWPLSPLCDSAATSRAGSQINFIEL